MVPVTRNHNKKVSKNMSKPKVLIREDGAVFPYTDALAADPRFSLPADEPEPKQRGGRRKREDPESTVVEEIRQDSIIDGDE